MQIGWQFSRPVIIHRTFIEFRPLSNYPDENIRMELAW